MTANTIDCFKNRLDKFWNSQDVKFDYKQKFDRTAQQVDDHIILMSVISIRSWWIGHRGFSLRPKLSVRSFVRSFVSIHSGLRNIRTSTPLDAQLMCHAATKMQSAYQTALYYNGSRLIFDVLRTLYATGRHEVTWNETDGHLRMVAWRCRITTIKQQ